MFRWIEAEIEVLCEEPPVGFDEVPLLFENRFEFIREIERIVQGFGSSLKQGIGVLRVVTKEDACGPTPDVAIHPVFAFVAVAKDLFQGWNLTGFDGRAKAFEAAPMGYFDWFARDYGELKNTVAESMRRFGFCHAFHEPRRAATAEGPVHHPVGRFVKQQVASIVFGRLFDEENFVGQLKAVIEGRGAIEQPGLFEDFSITDPVDCQRPLPSICNGDVPFLAPLHKCLIENFWPGLNFFIDRLVCDKGPLAGGPCFQRAVGRERILGLDSLSVDDTQSEQQTEATIPCSARSSADMPGHGPHVGRVSRVITLLMPKHIVLKHVAPTPSVIRRSERVATGCSERVQQHRGHARGTGGGLAAGCERFGPCHRSRIGMHRYHRRREAPVGGLGHRG